MKGEGGGKMGGRWVRVVVFVPRKANEEASGVGEVVELRLGYIGLQVEVIELRLGYIGVQAGHMGLQTRYTGLWAGYIGLQR